ncbi:MAG: malate synthase A, partial [Candidatus Heimdallarchaeota archaeon]
WQWLKHRSITTNGEKITYNLVKRLMNEELMSIKLEIGEDNYTLSKFDICGTLFFDIVTNENFAEFFTLEAYKYL